MKFSDIVFRLISTANNQSINTRNHPLSALALLLTIEEYRKDVGELLDSCTPEANKGWEVVKDMPTYDLVCSLFVKSFRQTDVTKSSAIDMVFWHLFQDRNVNLDKIFKYASIWYDRVIINGEDPKKTTDEVVNDFDWS